MALLGFPLTVHIDDLPRVITLELLNCQEAGVALKQHKGMEVIYR